MTIDPAQPVPSFSVRLLTPADAQAIPELAERVNGPNYSHREMYHPAELLRLNREGRLISVVAISSEGKVVGHFGLERPDLGLIGEAGEAMVLPEYRHHHVMEQMRRLVEQEATAVGLTGLIGHAVTHHVFSQLMEDQYHDHPIGVMFGFASAAAMNVEGTFHQRLSAVVYFRYLRKSEAGEAYVAPHHQEMMQKIYAALGRDTRLLTGAGGTAGRIEFSVSDCGTGEIEIVEAGVDCSAQVRDAVRAMQEQSQTTVFYARIPLLQPGAASVCAELEQQGFFFSGLVPGGTPEQDRLQLQRLDMQFSFDEVHVENAFGKEIFAYATGEYARVNRASSPK